MNVVYYIVCFFIGACFVSCGNCIVYRVTRGMDWVRGHSVCEGCGKRLRVWELVPVISCLVLRGRCPRCGCYFGYTHAQSEFAGGFLSVILALGHDDLISAFTPVFVFGVTYCAFCWFDSTYNKTGKT